MFGPYGVADSTKTRHEVHGVKLSDASLISVYPCLLHPLSRGAVRLRSPSNKDAPVVDMRLLGDPADAARFVEVCRTVRTILSSDPIAAYVTSEKMPGDRVSSDAEWEEHLRSSSFGMSHPVGTCRMGSDRDDGAVVDPQLRVRNVGRLRVIDASVMPTLVSGNTNACTIMIAERAADLIRTKETSTKGATR
jgi:choline dehydrogenase